MDALILVIVLLMFLSWVCTMSYQQIKHPFESSLEKTLRMVLYTGFWAVIWLGIITVGMIVGLVVV